MAADIVRFRGLVNITYVHKPQLTDSILKWSKRSRGAAGPGGGMRKELQRQELVKVVFSTVHLADQILTQFLHVTASVKDTHVLMC